MANFATFPGDNQYHLLDRAARLRTFCNLSTKGARRGVRERRPSAVVTHAPPTPNYSPCLLCMARVGQTP